MSKSIQQQLRRKHISMPLVLALHLISSLDVGSSRSVTGSSPPPNRPSSMLQNPSRINPTSEQQLVSSPDNATDTLKIVTGSDADALMYLKRYGYMSQSQGLGSGQLVSEDSFSEAISSFQRFAGIPVTGHVDERTELLMRTPRCGNSDKPIEIKLSRSLGRSQPTHGRLSLRQKRYALQGSKWRRQELTYRISQYPTRFNGKRHEVDSQIEKAFGIWSKVAPIDFVVKREGRVHIDIRFASGDHGDGDAFDGPGNTLAHAYFPQYGGDAHFDDQEYWTVDSYAGTNIFQVAAHELGHSLGLGHSNVREALMAPFYQKYKPNFKLHVDDILAIQALYGEKLVTDAAESGQDTVSPTTGSTTTSSSTTSAPSGSRQWPSSMFGHRSWSDSTDQRPANGHESDDSAGPASDLAPGSSPVPAAGSSTESGESAGQRPSARPASQPADLCAEPQIDAITRTQDGSSYVFRGDHYWLLTNEGLAKGYPRRISQDWEGLPGQLDAALTWADGKTFFFKGNKYWRYRNKRRDLGYPKLISAGFSGIPDDIDAAFVWSGNGRTYIFKGAEYWRFDSKAEPPVSSEYPRSIKVWSGLPLHVNAAFRWENNVTYFFKGSQYYRFNDKEFRVESRGRPAFPRPTAEWWFGCQNSNLAQRTLSSSLREAASLSGQFESNNQESADWSFYADQNQTNIMGTHISDHHQKPQSFAGETQDESWPRHEASFNSHNSPHDGTNHQTNSHRRVDLNHQPATRQTTISSSAISNHIIIRVPNMALVVLIVILNSMLTGKLVASSGSVQLMTTNQD